MKKTLMVLCLFLTSAAFGQYIATHIDSPPQVYHAPDHPGHASYTAMATEQIVVGGGSVLIAQGERPFSDFPQTAPVPLGDLARALKKQHSQDKKSRYLWENQ